MSDHLTGTGNRAVFYAVGREKTARCGLSRLPLAVVMLDVDSFKEINDSWGHPAGDAALRHLAKICQQRMRAPDVFARLGGEEFAVLLPGCDLARAQGVAERLRRGIENSLLHGHGGFTMAPTASLGVAVGRDARMNIDALVQQADAALYAAKAAGRNCVRAAPSGA